MTECQGCGAWNDANRTLCVLCGTPLAETDEWDPAAELPPLPPLPDGGLRVSMPNWLREPPQPGPDAAPVPAPPFEVAATAHTIELEPLGSQADPRTFLTDDDFPRWLRDLAAREAARLATMSDNAYRPPHLAADSPGASAWPDWPLAHAPLSAAADARLGAHNLPEVAPTPASAAASEPALVPALAAASAAASNGRPSPIAMATPAREERRTREPWETLLLVLLFIGVVVAALWALASNGVFSPAL